MTYSKSYDLVKLLTFQVISISMIFCPALSFAQTTPQNNIVVDQNAHAGGQNPFFEKSQNGTDVLNIVAPTQAGVSHNKFTEYNVNEQGLIVNNLTFQHGVGQAESQLGGTVAYNKNLGLGNAARVILNEVTSNSISSLRGYTEVFGAKAALIIANPNGITCEGCGFLNTSKLTMITGSSNMVNGNIQDFNMNTTGIIEILGKGSQNVGLHVDGSPAQIVSNSVKIAGLVLLDDNQQLDIMTGNDKFDYNNSTVTSDNAHAVGVAVDSSALGGMYAGRIKIHATQKGFGVNTEGGLVASMDNVEITADGDIVYKNIAAEKNVQVISEKGNIKSAENGTTFAGREVLIASLDANVELLGDYVYSSSIGIKSGNDIINKSQIFSDDTIILDAGRDLNNYGDIASITNAQAGSGRDIINQTSGKIIAGEALGLYSANDLLNKGDIASSYMTEVVAMNNIFNEGKISSATLVNMYARNNFTNKNEISSGSALLIETGNNIYNQSKINAVDGLGLKSANIHNYGQIASNGDIGIETSNDFINYRDSAILAGGSIIFTVAHNLINYMAEIFGVSDITFSGSTGVKDAVNLSIAYDNPYITDTRNYDGSGNGHQDVNVGEEETFESLEIYLTDLGVTLSLPLDAFGANPQPGDSYTFLDGYKVTLGADIDDLIITDEFDVPVNFSLFDDTKQEGEVVQEGGGNTTRDENNNLGPFANSTPFVPKADAMNSLQNIGGRIESFANININSDKLVNLGMDYNKGTDGYTVAYNKIRDAACWNCGTMELGRYYISETNFSSIGGMILAGNDLNISSRDILNQSSTLSAKNNITIKTDNLRNQTSSYLVNLAIQYEARKKSKNSTGRTSKKIWRNTGYYQDRVYSKVFSLITAGANLIIDATGGSVTNDQVENATGSFFFGRDNAPDTPDGSIAVNVNLPNGTNGLFVVGHDPKYLVTSNVSFLDASNFIGSDYFFDRITPISTEFNTRKIIGDAAYETRLVMDALRQATFGHYLTDEIGSDVDQMKVLYAAAEKEYKALNLKVGVALSEEQIEALTNDIIWYVEKEVAGQMVLVPELYLCEATRVQIASGSGSGAKMTASNIAIKGDTINNSGDIFAQNQLYLKADYLNNESNWLNQARIMGARTNIDVDTLRNASGLLGGGTTLITAKNVTNETKVYSEETRFGKNYNLTQKTGHEAVIFGDTALQMNVEETLVNKGATLESSQGDVFIQAKNVEFDTVELHNRTEQETKKSGFLSKKTTTNVTDSVKNVGSTVNAAGNLVLKTEEDASFRGTTVNAGDNALLDVGGDLNVFAATDHDYSYSKTTKSSLGGLKKSVRETENYEESLKGSNVTVVDGLTIKSGKDTNIVGSDIVAGGDLNMDVGENLNIITGTEQSYSRYYKDNSSFSGSKTKENIDISLTNVHSNLKAGNNLNIKTGDNINSIGTNFAAGNEINMEAVNDVNLLNATDYTYSYDYYNKEKKDFAAIGIGTIVGGMSSAVTNPTTMGVTGGVGGYLGASDIKKGRQDIVETYDEKTVSGTLVADKINITSGNDTNIISNDLVATDIDITAGNEIFIGTATENHTKYEKHGKYDVDYFGVAEGAAIGGGATSMLEQIGAQTADMLVQGAGPIGMAAGSAGGIAANREITSFAGQEMKENESYSSSSLQTSSNLIASNNINLTSKNDLEIKGSNIIAGKDANITSTDGSVNITSAQEVHTEWSKSENMSDHDISFFNGSSGDKVKSGINIAEVEKNWDKSKEEVSAVVQKGSYVATGNDLNISAGRGLDGNITDSENAKVNISGSTLFAEKDVNIFGRDGVNITPAENTFFGKSTEKDGKISMGVDIGNNILYLFDQISETQDAYSENGNDTPGNVNKFAQTGNTAIAGYNAFRTIGSFGFTAKLNVGVNYSETDASNQSLINSSSKVSSADGNVNISSHEGDVNIKGSHISAKDDINIATKEGGDINISSSVDTSSAKSDNDSYSLSTTLDLASGGMYIPTIGYTSSKRKYNEISNNNSTLTSENGGVNITANEDNTNKKSDINIEGANISAEKDINLNAESGDTVIASTQDTLSSNDKYNSYNIGGTIGFGIGKDKVETVTNNLTTIESKSGDVNLNTNNLILTEVNKDNLNLDKVAGNITENQLHEKDERDMYDVSANFEIPYSISVFGGLGSYVEGMSQDVADALGFGEAFKNAKEASKKDFKPIDPNKEITYQGDWLGSFLNTTISYRDDKGYDFTASPASVMAPGMLIKDAIESYIEPALTWNKGGEARYKHKTDDGKTPVDHPDASNIGMSVIRPTEDQYKRNPENYPNFDPTKGGYAGEIVGSDGFKPLPWQEGGTWMKKANEVPGMNIMSVFHDKFSDYPIMNSPGVLQATIIPAIASTYYGLVAKDTQQSMAPINWDNMEKLKGNEQGNNVNNYIQQQQKKVEELQNKYLNQ